MSASWSTFQTRLSQYLCPPGDGVYTVHTAKARKQSLQQALYGRSENIEPLWKKSLTTLPDTANVLMLGICSDCGGGVLRGANWGPLFLRSALQQYQPALPLFDIGDVRVIPHLLHDKYLNDATLAHCRKALYGDETVDLAVSPLSITQAVVQELYTNFPDKRLFAVGGDHSVSYPLVYAYLQAKKAQHIKVAVIHFDAHTDLMSERLGIDLCFGTWCRHILNELQQPNHLVQIGIRSSGHDKAYWQETVGVRQYWAHEVRQQGAQAIADIIVVQLKKDNIEELYISLDIDALDAQFAAATGTPEPNGLTPEDIKVILSCLKAHFSITAADIMEIAPFLHTSEQLSWDGEATLKTAAELSAILIKLML